MQEAPLEDLYSETGRYTYYKGYNYRAFAATLLGAFISLIRMYVPAFSSLYDISWFAGVLASSLSCTALMYVHPPYTQALKEMVRDRAAE
ncbi:hypothetical protein AXI59_14430 [Bacillus nakamurai]|nr:hypothetical protein AXI59_14430 [Bacillus nakamurai]